MDAKMIRRLKSRLNTFLKEFADCFTRKDTRMHLTTYVNGQLSDLRRKSVEPIALAQRVPPRTLQNFLSVLSWKHQAVRDRVADVVCRDHAHPHAVGVIDETSDDKNGRKTPGVNRQWCGSKGKVENCIVTVHLAYATPDFHCLLDGDLFLPQDWSDDRRRCRDAGIPDDVVYRPKWEIALELYDRAVANGVQFEWITFDEGYGSKPGFLRRLADRKQWFVGEVPTTFTGGITLPETTDRPYRKAGRGRTRRTPRLKAGSLPARSVAHHRQYSPVFGALADRLDAARTGVGPLPRQRRRERADHLGSQTRADLSCRRRRPAGRAAAPGGLPQSARRRDQVFRGPRAAGDFDGGHSANRLFAVESGALLRGRQTGSRPGALRRPDVAGP